MALERLEILRGRTLLLTCCVTCKNLSFLDLAFLLCELRP